MKKLYGNKAVITTLILPGILVFMFAAYMHECLLWLY